MATGYTFHFPGIFLPFRPSQLCWLVHIACASALTVNAQSVPPQQGLPANPPTQVATVTTLKEIVVSGSRIEQSADELPQAIEVINAKDIEEGQLRDIRDIGKSLPNVSVRRSPARFTLAGNPTGREGNAGFNIRGLEGNRVLLLVDGIRIPRSYSFGASSFGRDSLSIDLVKRVEIIKGPASALYGSDGIAGLVNFITYEPSDFLQDGKTLGGKAAISYSGDDKGLGLSATLARRAGDSVDWQITGAATRSQELANLGTNAALNGDRTLPNPQRDKGSALLAKVVVRPTSAQKHTLAFEHVVKDTDYELFTARAKPPLTATSVIGSTALSELTRDRLTWTAAFKLDSSMADQLQTVVSYQNAESRSLLLEDRNTAADRSRDTTYAEKTWQLSALADKTFRLSSDWAQKLSYGVDYTRATIQTLQTGLVPPAGETFPLKRFPDTVESASAVFVQSELIHNVLSITPGVRIDRFQIKPSQTGFPVPAVGLSGSAVSPKVGVLIRATPEVAVFGNYASGFRAPNAGQVNAFFENVTQFYKSIPNPNLKPEKSKNFEFGARANFAALTLEASVFEGDFTNLIEDNRQISGNFTAANPTINQSVNINSATINGFEIKGNVQWGKFGAVSISTPFSYGEANGVDNRTGLPLDSIDPAKLTLGVRFESANWNLRLDATKHAAKNRADIGAVLATTPLQFTVPASTTFDLSGQWTIVKGTRLNASVVNLTNRKYWNWSEARGIASNAVALDSYTQPGRKFNVSLVTDF